MTNEEAIMILKAMIDEMILVFDRDRKKHLIWQSPHLRSRCPKNQKIYSPLRTLPDIHSQRVENVHVAEKLLSIIAIRGCATFVDKQLIGVMVIMIDLISRKDAIDLEYIVKNINGVDYVMLSEVQMRLRKLPSVEPEQRWTPVSERMPEPRIDVWCNSDMGQMVGYYEENVETWYGRDYLELMVTAWMPLPEPYRDAQ